jgi:hypothetical protein
VPLAVKSDIIRSQIYNPPNFGSHVGSARQPGH